MNNNHEDFDPESLNWTHPNAKEIDDLEKRIRQHPGNRLSTRLDQLNRVFDAWVGFSMAFSELLKKCETDEEIIVELMRNVGDLTKRKLIIRSLDQVIIAYTAGLGAVIDQSRGVVQSQSITIQNEYTKRAAVIMKNHSCGLFLAKLRNYVLHNVAAPWTFHGTFGEVSAAQVALDSATLLENKKAWTREAKEFIAANGASIHLSPLIDPYLDAMIAHIGWIFPTVAQDNARLLDDCDDLIRERNLLLSGGASDGHDWENQIKHMEENLQRIRRGEPQTDFRTGLHIVE